ncbi:MAG: sugar nucleotide-binding protein [Myxococcales bacterium]
MSKVTSRRRSTYTAAARPAWRRGYSRSFSRRSVVRTAAFFGPWDNANFVTRTLADAADGREIVAADDAVISPTYVVDLVHAALDLLIDGESGVWHLANRGAITWAALARLAIRYAGMDTSLVAGRPTHTLGLRARRPRYSVLGSERGALMPPLEDALQRYFLDRNGRQVRERVRERRRAPREIGVAVQ